MAITRGTSDNKGKSKVADAFDAAYQEAATTAPSGGATEAKVEEKVAKSSSGEYTGRKGVLSMNTTLGRPMGRKSTGEVIIAYQEAFNDVIKKNFKENFEDKFKLVPFEATPGTGNVYGAFLVCFQAQVKGHRHIAVYTLIIEESGPDRLSNKTVPIGDRTVQVIVTPGDVFNNNFWNGIQSHIKSISGAAVNVHDAGVMVIPREMSASDTESVRKCIYNATQATFTVMDSIAGGVEEPFTVDWLKQDGGQTMARLEYNPGPAESATGEPIRSDCRVALQYKLPNTNINSFEESIDLGISETFTQLILSPPPLPAPGQVPETRSYVPQVVITKLDTAHDAITMELILLAMAQTTLLSSNMAWAGCFKPTGMVKGRDIRDIGALGYQLSAMAAPDQPPVKIDTKRKDFDDRKLWEFIRDNIRDVLEYAIDIEEVGELTWLKHAFSAVAIDPNNQDQNAARAAENAYQVIINAANNLTNGHFSKRFPGGPITIYTGNRIHLGYYTDNNGVRRDIRDIDMIAMLNMAAPENMGDVWKFMETYDMVNVPSNIRMEDRANIIKSYVASAVFKGYARRYIINGAFLTALAQSCFDAGLVIRPENLIQDFTGTGIRGVANAGQYGVQGGNLGGLFNFNAGGPDYGNNAFQAGAFYGRFGR